jgi:hypothetical protein
MKLGSMSADLDNMYTLQFNAPAEPSRKRKVRVIQVQSILRADLLDGVLQDWM